MQSSFIYTALHSYKSKTIAPICNTQYKKAQSTMSSLNIGKKQRMNINLEEKAMSKHEVTMLFLIVKTVKRRNQFLSEILKKSSSPMWCNSETRCNELLTLWSKCKWLKHCVLIRFSDYKLCPKCSVLHNPWSLAERLTHTWQNT